MQEILLIIACITAKGCSETSIAYSHHNKTSVEHIKNTAKTVEQRINGAYTPYLVAFYSVYTEKAVVLSVNKHTNMEFSNENIRINYTIEY